MVTDIPVQLQYPSAPKKEIDQSPARGVQASYAAHKLAGSLHGATDAVNLDARGCKWHSHDGTYLEWTHTRSHTRFSSEPEPEIYGKQIALVEI